MEKSLSDSSDKITTLERRRRETSKGMQNIAGKMHRPQ